MRLIATPAPPPLQRRFIGQNKVGGFVLELDIGVADDPEQPLGVARVARKEMLQRQTDNLFQHDEADRAAGLGRQANEALHLAGQRDERAHDVAVMVGDQQQRHHQPHVGDEGKGMRRVDGERGQNRKDAFHEEGVQPRAVGRAERLHLANDQPGMGEFALHAMPGVLLIGDQPTRADVHVGKLLRGRQPVGRERREARLRLTDEAGHTNGIELVEVGATDRDEAQALQQRMVAVLGFLDDAVVEIEPGQLPVDEPRRRVQGDGLRGRVACRIQMRMLCRAVRQRGDIVCC